MTGTDGGDGAATEIGATMSYGEYKRWPYGQLKARASASHIRAATREERDASKAAALPGQRFGFIMVDGIECYVFEEHRN